MYDFIRAACAVPAVSVGDVKKNVEGIIEKCRTEADIIVFPELCVTGYTCQDLFFQETLLKEAEKGILQIAEKTADNPALIAVGAPLRLNGRLYNCAVVIKSGKVIGIVPKTYLPNYNEFYEKRWFSSAADLDITEVFMSGYEIPVGNDLIFDLNGVKIGAEICEDLWSPLPPSSFHALNGAEVIINLSASNEVISKRRYRRELVSQQSARSLAAYIYSSAGPDESTTDLVFSGHSIICENGAIIAESEDFISNDYLLISDIDLGKIKSDRMKLTSFGDAAAFAKPSERVVPAGEHKFIGNGEFYKIKKLPFVPSSKAERLERCRNIFSMQAAGLKKRLAVTNAKAVVGVSGGLDSTLALLTAVEAVRTAGRPATDVVGITMPCFGTTDRTYNNAVKLMETLGITHCEINIREACLLHMKDIGHNGEPDVTYENIQARERTQVLMDYAGKIGGLVVGTGDLSELALGWCTYNADHMSMYGVNASIPKTLIRWMIESLIEYDIFKDSTEVLKDIADTPISPELLPPDADGKISQQTESIVGPYALHDFFLYYMLRYGFEPSKIFFLAKKAFEGEFDSDTIKKWLKVFYRRFFTQQFKRSCMPDGVKVGSVCLSPRGDFRMPSDASCNLWLKEAENL